MSKDLSIEAAPSPNFDDRKSGTPIDILVLHYTGMPSAKDAVARLTDPRSKVSAHYTIDESGKVYVHVAEAKRAWHAGVSHWSGSSDVNSRSIGIELVNPGHEFGYKDFPPAQIEALCVLARGILARHPIPPHRVLGHSDVAPARKTDPGERFPWALLAARGIGLWSDARPGAGIPTVAAAQAQLARFGYGLRVSGAMDEDTVHAVSAFQRHFRPAAVTGELDAETFARLADLLVKARL